MNKQEILNNLKSEEEYLKEIKELYIDGDKKPVKLSAEERKEWLLSDE